MNRLQMATLLSWAEADGIQGRKRLQKVVFMLQCAGCRLGCRYTFQHFGPYSRDVADACDELVAAGLVDEQRVETAGGGVSYAYALKPEARRFLAQGPDAAMQRFRELGSELIRADPWQLELGSTILFFHAQNADWEQALVRACEFNWVPPTAEASRNALALAQRVHGCRMNSLTDTAAPLPTGTGAE